METLDLFADDPILMPSKSPHVIRAATQDSINCVQGLSCYYDFVEATVERELLRCVDGAPWLTDLERRVQHYGYKYDYKARRINESMRLGELPSWLRVISKQLAIRGIFETEPDQVIVNEYLPGQGITSHVDCEPCFGETVASLSLGSGCVMEFTSLRDFNKIPVYLEPRSTVVLRGEARYNWRHGIPKRLSDTIAGSTVARGRRVSLTFRNVIQSSLGAHESGQR